MTEFRCAITGGRDPKDIDRVTSLVLHTLTGVVMHVMAGDYCQPPLRKFVLIHGNARGVDSIGKAWAINKGIEHRAFNPEYNKYHPKIAPLKRNEEMAKYNLNLAIAFPGNTGTAHMYGQCVKNGVITLDLRDGKLDYDDYLRIIEATTKKCN